MLQRLLEAPWPDPHDMPAIVREQAKERIHHYWQTRGWQLVLGEVILWAATEYQNIPHARAYGLLAGFIALAYLMGLPARWDSIWLFGMVNLFLLQGMLINNLGAVTAMSFMLPYTFAGMLLEGRRRVFIQAWCIVYFWTALLYEVFPDTVRLHPPRNILVSYEILLAAFTFQSLRYLNQLSVELNTGHVATEVRHQVQQQSQHFLARVSHELRTPLNSVLGFAKLLRKAELSSAQRGYLHQIIDEGEQLNRLVSDLLDSAHLATGKLTLHPEPCQVNAICEMVVEEHRPNIKETVQFNLELLPNLPEIQADPTRMRQIIGNLVSNAMKHTETGSITVRTSRQEKTLEIAVIDTGPGIPEDQKELIFVPFVQIDGRRAGVGLGLDIALQLSRLHGGHIRLNSETGKGSTFIVSLPL